MKVSILHPCRHRVEKSWFCMSEWILRAGVDVEAIISIDSSDPRKDEFLKIYEGFNIIVNDNNNAVQAVNQAAKVATGDVMVVVSDDFTCPSDWGTAIERVTKGHKDWVLKVYDGTQEWLITLPILDRTYYERFGYIYPEVYEHMFADTEFTHVADMLGKIIIRNDLRFEHKHYSTLPRNKRVLDEVTIKADATFEPGKKIYLERVKNNFGLPLNAMNIKNEGHKQWLLRNMI